MFKVSYRSANRLRGVHPLLQACVMLAMRKYSEVDFGVGAGALRTEQEQRMLVLSRKSKTMDSKHLPQEGGFSHAVDLYPSGYKSIEEIPEQDWVVVAAAMSRAAEDLGLALTHGLDWGWDSPHHEIKIIT